MNKRKDDQTKNQGCLSEQEGEAKNTEDQSEAGVSSDPTLKPTVIHIGRAPMAGCTFRRDDALVTVEIPIGSFKDKTVLHIANLFKSLSSKVLNIGPAEIELRASIQEPKSDSEVLAGYVLILPSRVQVQVASPEFQECIRDVARRLGLESDNDITYSDPVALRSSEEARVESIKTEILKKGRLTLGNTHMGECVQIQSDEWEQFSYALPHVIPATEPEPQTSQDVELIGVFDGFHGRKRRAYFEVIGKTSSHTRELSFDEFKFRQEVEERSKSGAKMCVVTLEEKFEGSVLISATIKSIDDDPRVPLFE